MCAKSIYYKVIRRCLYNMKGALFKEFLIKAGRQIPNTIPTFIYMCVGIQDIHIENIDQNLNLEVR